MARHANEMHRLPPVVACGAFLALASIVSIGLSLPARAEESAPEPRATMHQIYAALAYLLPASLDEERFVDPARREETLYWLDRLANSAVLLEQHSERRDIDFRNLSRSLAADATEVRSRYDLGEAEEARYFLMELTRTCVACHERLPAARDFPFSDRMLEKIDLDALSVHEQAQIFVATRQFDRALAAWESLFRDPSVLPAQMDLGGYLIDYLTVSVRVERDAKRPQLALTALAARPDTPRYLRRHIESWVAALAELEGEVSAAPSVSRARALMTRAEASSAFPADRRRLVYDLVASSLLLRYVDAAAPDDPDLAEAFYWLGVAESRSIDTFWVPRTEFHFEAAIRQAPKGPFAADAYALLEEYITFGYGGVFGEDALPVDVWARLEELRQLIGEPSKAGGAAVPRASEGRGPGK